MDTMPSPTSARARLAVLMSVSALALVGCGSSSADDPSPTSGSAQGQQDPTPTDPASDPASDASSGSSGSSPSAPAGETKAVAVYYVGDTPQGPRLYREFHKVDAGDPATGAVAALTSTPSDPDYRTLFPSGTVDRVDIGSDAITVDVPESWTTPADGMTDAQARLAGQQLVYTVQAAAQSRLPVHVEHAGAPADLFGLGGELGNEPENDVKALVNVTSPEEGATVSGSFTASGVSNSPEATTPWEVHKGGADGPVVAEGYATADGWMDKLYPWQTAVDVSRLPAGDYTFVVRTDDPSDGEGAGPTVDTKSITVR